MSIPPDSPGRGAAAWLPQPVNEVEQQAAGCIVEAIYGLNCRSGEVLDGSEIGATENNTLLGNTVIAPLDDIMYRSSDGDWDLRNHVFRWDTTSYEQVFVQGFRARDFANTPDDRIHYNLELYVNSGGRPLDSRRDITHCFVSTTASSRWYPSPSSTGEQEVFRYEIYAPGGIWVKKTLLKRYKYTKQQEVAFPVGIAPQYIRSAQRFVLKRVGRYPRATRVDETLHINSNFNPQSHPQRKIPIRYPISHYKDDENKTKKLKTEIYRHRVKRAVGTSNADLIEYYIEEVTTIKSYIDSAFRSTVKNEAYLFFQDEYVRLNYAPATTDDWVVNGPLYISDGFPSLVDDPFAAYGIDAAFGCHNRVESFIFSGNTCAKIDYAPGTTDDKILEGPKTIRQMFTCFEGTNFEKGVDAAFESSKPDEVYIFKGREYARVDYNKREVIVIRPIVEGFHCLKNTIFDSDIGAAFTSHDSDHPKVAYLFKGNSYVLLHATPGENNDCIIGGPKEIVPNNWPSLANILPRDNAGLDIYDGPRPEPHEHVHNEL